MKPRFPVAALAAVLITGPALITGAAAPAAAQYGRGPQAQPRSLTLKPPGNWVVGHAQRAGGQQIIEWVPRGQTVQRYTKIITLTSFVAQPGVGPSTVMENFSNRYRNACRGTRVSTVSLGGGNVGVRMDCPRSPMSGKPETVFARVIYDRPTMAILQYMTAYPMPPGEAAFAREFIGSALLR